MPTVLKLRRGTTTQNNAFTGAEGEISIDTQKDTLIVHDGSTAGGHELARTTGTQTLTNKTLTSPVISTITGSTITLDSAGDINLDADGADVILKDDGTEYGRFTNSSTDFVIKSAVSDKDIIFKGNDGGSEVTALTLDMSAAGNATFAADLTVTGNFTVNGTTTTVSTTNTTVSDNLLELNSGAGSNANDSGILIERGSTGDNAFIGFDESADKFIVGTTTATNTATGNLTISTGTLVANVEGNITGNVTGNASGTAATVTGAAQSNITSLGTLTTLTVDNVIINGTTIGHTDDTDLITLADGIATVAGEISVTTLDIGGTNVTSTAAEINIIDGNTSAGTTAVAGGDGIVTNDNGTMRQTTVDTFDTYLAATTKTLTNKTTTNLVLNGTATGTAIKDEDNMASDSATHIATQQSIKAYVDTEIGNISSTAISQGNSNVTVADSGTGNVTIEVDGADRITTLAATTTTATGHSIVLGAGSTSAAGQIKFLEGTDNGTNGVTLIGPASTADVTVTLPAAADTLVGKATTDTLTNKSIDLGNNTLTGSLAEFNSALQSESFVSLTGSETLTNKVLTTPTLTTPVANAGIQLKNGATSAGFLEFFEDSDNGTNKVTLIGPASTADVTVTLPAAADTLVGKATTDTLTNKSIDLGGNTLTGSLAEFNSALQSESFTSLTGSETLTNKTLTTPIITTPTINAGGDLKNGATSAGFLKFFEDSDNGTNAVTFIGPASTADITITLPTQAGTVVVSNQTAGNDVRVDSLGVAVDASGTSGEIRATNDITAFHSSDVILKENINNIPNPMDMVSKLNGVLFDWKDSFIKSKGGEDGYFVRKKDVGVVAQDVESVLPEIVGTRPDGIKAVKYDRLCALLIECVKDLQEQVNNLKK